MKQSEQSTNVRETFTEYDVGGTKIAVIKDPENKQAWIQSTVSYPNRP